MADPASLVARGIEGTGAAYINKGIGITPGQALGVLEQRRREKEAEKAKKAEANQTQFQKIRDLSTPWAEYGKVFSERQQKLINMATTAIRDKRDLQSDDDIQQEMAFLTNMAAFSKQQEETFNENFEELRKNPNKYDVEAYEQELARWRKLPDEDKLVTPIPQLSAVYRIQQDIDNYMKDRPDVSYKVDKPMMIGGKNYIQGEEIKGKLTKMAPVLDKEGNPTGQFEFTGYGVTDDMLQGFVGTYPKAMKWAESQAEQLERTTGERKAPEEILRQTIEKMYAPSASRQMKAGVNFAPQRPREKKEDKVTKTIEYDVLRNYNQSQMKPGEQARVKAGIRPIEISYAEEGGNKPIMIAPTKMINIDKNSAVQNTNVAGTTGQTGRLGVRILATQLWPYNVKTGKLVNFSEAEMQDAYSKGLIDFKWMGEGVYEDTTTEEKGKNRGKTKKVENRVLIDYEDIKKELLSNYKTTPDELATLKAKYIQEKGLSRRPASAKPAATSKPITSNKPSTGIQW